MKESGPDSYLSIMNLLKSVSMTLIDRLLSFTTLGMLRFAFGFDWLGIIQFTVLGPLLINFQVAGAGFNLNLVTGAKPGFC